MDLIKNKTEVYLAIESFINMANTQYNAKVQVIISDNGKEFMNFKCA